MSKSFDINFDIMKAIQIVVDEGLLARVDRSARQLKTSRSAVVRHLLEVGLEQEGLTALARKEARAYAKTSESKEDRDAIDALGKAQKRVLDDLGRTERW